MTCTSVHRHRLGGKQEHAGAQGRVGDYREQHGVRPQAGVHKLRLQVVGKGIRIAAQGVELAQVEAEELCEKLCEDDVGERARLLKGDGEERQFVGRQERAGASAPQIGAELGLTPDLQEAARPQAQLARIDVEMDTS
jgi:hypothetical protein